MESSVENSPPLEIRHKTQQSHDSGAYLDWSSEESASPTGSEPFSVSGEFVTVVAVGAEKADTGAAAVATPKETPEVPFVTVLAIGSGEEDTTTTTLSLPLGEPMIEGAVEEEVLVYRLPGERLGFGLKFEGGVKSAEKVRRLFIQSCAQDSPACRARCSWGALEEGDELVQIDGVSVNTMTRIDCVRCLKESHVVIKLFVRHRMSAETCLITETADTDEEKKKTGLELKATQSVPLSSTEANFTPLTPAKSTGDLPLVISAEMKKCLPQPSQPPPIPPRKLPRKPSAKDVSIAGAVVSPCSEAEQQQSPRAAVRTSLQQESPEFRSAPTTPRVRQRLEARHSYQSSPEVSRHGGRRLFSAAPPEAEVYLDLLALEEISRLRNESESDDTGSSLSTVVDRFSTTNSSFSDLRSSASSTCDLTTPSTPTSTSTPNIDLAKVLGPFEQLEREFSANAHIDDDFLLSKLVASEETFSKLQTSKGVSAEQLALLLVASSRSNDDDPMTLQPPPNFQDFPHLNGQEPSPPAKRPTNKILTEVEVRGEDGVEIKPRSTNKDGDGPALPPKPLPRKVDAGSSRFRSGKKRPPPPPPPRHDRPQCPKPFSGEDVDDIEASMVEVDLTETSELPDEEQECAERYPVGVDYLPRLVDVTHKGHPRVADEEPETRVDSGEEDEEPISLDFSVLDQNEDISIAVPALTPVVLSASDLEDSPVVAVIPSAAVLELDEARILEDDGEDPAEFQITAVTCTSDVFFPYHWSVTSHLATIGEDEEEEAAAEHAPPSCERDEERSSSGDASASLRETAELGSGRGSGALGRPTIELTEDVEDSDQHGSPSQPISKQKSDDAGNGLQSDAPLQQNLQNERGLDVVRPARKEKLRAGNDVEVQPTLKKRATEGGDDQVADVTARVDSTDTGVRGTMDALLALDSLTASTTIASKAPPSLAYPPSDTSLSPPPSFSRLPPDGHEFPPNYQEPNHFSVGVPALIEMDLLSEKTPPVDTPLVKPTVEYAPPPPLPMTAPPVKMPAPLPEGNAHINPPARKFSASSVSSGIEDAPPRPRPPSWRQDEKSEKSVRDKIAMFASQEDGSLPQPVQNGARRLSSHSFKSTENIFYDDTVDCSSGSLPTGKVLSRSIVTVDKIGQSNNSYPFRQTSKSTSSVTQSHKGFAPYASTGDVSFNSGTSSDTNNDSSSSLEYTRTLSSMDLTSPSPFNHSSVESTTHSSPHSYGYSSTLPRKMNGSKPAVVPSPFSTIQRKHGTTDYPRLSNNIRSVGSDNLHSRSQSLIDVGSVGYGKRNSIAHDGSKSTAEEMRRASLNALIEQRRKSMSKLRGLVIPEKVSEMTSHTIFDLPEIKSRDSILATKPPLLTKDDSRFVNNQKNQANNGWVSKDHSYTSYDKPATITQLTTNLITPPWKSQTPASNLPKYSPAFKRKSLAVCGSSTASSVSSSLNSSREELRTSSEVLGKKTLIPPSKPPRNSTSISNNLHPRNNSPNNYSSPFLYSPDPPKSLESLTSPTRSDSSFEYIRDSSPELNTNNNGAIKNGDHILNDDHKKVSHSHSIKSMSDNGRSGEDDSDNDSAVSSSRSSISHEFSPPQSPIPDNTSRDNQHHTTRQHILLSPLPSSGSGNDKRPLRRTLSSETTASVASSTASTLTSGSQASCSSNGGSSSDGNSKRVLKAQSVEAINRKNVLSSARYSSGRDLKVGSPLIQRKFEEDDDRSDADEGEDDTIHDDSDLDQSTSGGEMEQAKDIIYYNTYTPVETHESEVKVAYLNIQDSTHDFDSLEIDHEEISRTMNGEVSVEETKDIEAPITPKAAPRHTSVNSLEHFHLPEKNNEVLAPVNGHIASVDEVDCKEKIEKAQKQAVILETRCTKVTSYENTQPNDSSVKKVMPVVNGHGVNGISQSTSESCKPVQRRNSNKLLTDSKTDEKADENELYNILQGRQHTERQKSKDDTFKSPTTGEKNGDVVSPPAVSRIPMAAGRMANNRRSVSVNDIRKAFEKAELALNNSNRTNNSSKAVNGAGGHVNNHHARVSSLDSTTSEDNFTAHPQQYGSASNLHREQYGSITSLASSTSLISQQELQVLIDEANQTLEELGGGSPPVHEVLVVALHREVVGGSVGIALAGGADYEAKEITVHKVLGGSPADKDGRIQKGDRILSINGKSMKGVTHRESQNILKTPRSEVILVVSRPRPDSIEFSTTTFNSSRPPRILEQLLEGETTSEEIARGPPVIVTLPKEGAGLGFSLEGGKDSPLGDKLLIIKKIFMGGSADKSGQLRAGDELLKVNDTDVTSMTRIEAWGLMKKLPEGNVSLTVRHAVENKSC